MKKIFFTPGPSQLFYTIEDHLKTGIKENIFSISHRSNDFKNIYQSCIENLKTFLQLPKGYHIGFLSSANEAWERIIQNLVYKTSTHLINGSFSNKFYDFAIQNNIEASKYFFNNEEYNLENVIENEMLAISLNETSTGVMCNREKISEIRKKFTNSIIALDCVSGIPCIPFNISDVDTFYFSVQKCFGLPAGLGVWIYNEKCLEKHKKLINKKITGTYHSLDKIHNMSLNNQTPETPNILGIYLFSKVLKDMINIGREMIVRETEYKSALLYNTISNHEYLKESVRNKNIQSKTIIVSNTKKESQYFIDELKRKNLIIGKGYGTTKNQIRIANFPTHSKEVMELLCDEIIKL